MDFSSNLKLSTGDQKPNDILWREIWRYDFEFGETSTQYYLKIASQKTRFNYTCLESNFDFWTDQIL